MSSKNLIDCIDLVEDWLNKGAPEPDFSTRRAIRKIVRSATTSRERLRELKTSVERALSNVDDA